MSETEKQETEPAEAATGAEAEREETAKASESVEPGEVPAPDDVEETAETDETDDVSPWAGKTSEDGGEAGEAPEERDYEAEIAELNDRLLRALAETENVRRRGQRDREETAKFAITGFARDVLSVADNLRRALEALPEDAGENEALSSLVGGIELTERELAAIFQRHGVEKIDPAGERFDHNLHEAMFEIPTADAEPGKVMQVVETGYVLNGRLLRAARVGIAKAPPEAETAPEPPPEDADTAA